MRNDKPSANPATADGGRRPTLKTIASITNLGVSTVSRALKDAPDISKQTKQLVRDVADEIGYTPNRAGVGLRTGKTNVITLVLSLDEEIMGLTAHLVRGISETLSNTSYHLTVTPHGKTSTSLDRVKYIAETRSADGIILSRTEPDDPRVSYLQKKRIPFATHGRTQAKTPHAFHDFDNESLVAKAVETLVKKQRRRIAMLGPPEHLTFYRHAMDGYKNALATAGLEEYPPLEITIDHSLDHVEMATYELFRRRDRPDGIVSLSGGSTIAVCSGIEKAGLTIGNEVDIVSKQAVNILPRFRKNIDIFNEDIHLAGRELAQQVVDLIDGADPATLQSLVAP